VPARAEPAYPSLGIGRAAGARYPKALQRSLEPITPKELTNRLRELEAAGIIHRRAYAEVPPASSTG
jgi:DNA-binding HxlR family transcriptional regulator